MFKSLKKIKLSHFQFLFLICVSKKGSQEQQVETTLCLHPENIFWQLDMSLSGKSVKRKRLSKNKKKNWRKTDIADVEEHLEDVRLQERTGYVCPRCGR